MKTVAGAMQTILGTNYGTEPVCIIEVQWVESGQWHLYANKDLPGVSGAILSVSTLESVIKLDSQGQTQQINITLSDTAGVLKDVIDNYNIHGRPCRVYQWFEGLPLSERFMLFEGEVVSDIKWTEGDRTLAFEAITKSQDREVGFSPEEGTFYAVPEDLVGVAWPLAFGFVQNVPAVQIQNFPSTKAREASGKLDPTLTKTAADIRAEIELITGRRDHYKQIIDIYEPFENLDGTPLADRDAEAAAALSEAQTNFSAYQGRLDWLEEYEANLESTRLQQEAYEKARLAIGDSSLYPQDTEIQLNINGVIYTGTFDGDDFIVNGSELPEFDGDYLSDFGFTFLEGGTLIKLGSESGSIYVANILSSTINHIRASKTTGGISRLTKIPSNYYTTEIITMGIYSVTLIKFTTPLSEYEGENWDSKIYVTLEGIVGPNTVTIMEWLIDTYTDLTYDAATFDYVKVKLENYPSNFALLTRTNIIALLEDIAFQARCAIWLIRGVFYIKYLPEEVVEVDTITESDVNLGTIEVSTSPSEELVTKLIAEWKESYSQEKSHQTIFRHNTDLYGVKERTIDFFIYNIPSLVSKAASFWIIRFANVWKKVSFATCLNKLTLETFDTVKFDFNTSYLADVDVKGLITNVSYTVDATEVQIEAWLPVLLGTMVQYDFAWPANVSTSLVFVFDPGDTPGQQVDDGDLPHPEYPRVTVDTDPIPDGDDLKPRVRFEYEAGEPPAAETREIEVEQTDIYIGQVTGKLADTIYSVQVYEDGREFEPVPHNVKQVDLIKKTTIPIGAWVFVIKHFRQIKTRTLFTNLQEEMDKANAAAREGREAYDAAAATEKSAFHDLQRAIIDYETVEDTGRNAAKERRDLAEDVYIQTQQDTLEAKAYWQAVEDYADLVQANLTAASKQALVELWDVATTPSVTISTGGETNDNEGEANPYTTVIDYSMQVVDTGGAVSPGKVISGSGIVYQVEIFESGLDGNIPDDPNNIKTVTQLQIPPDGNIRPGTWALIHKQSVPDPDISGSLIEEYTMQAINVPGEIIPGVILSGSGANYVVDIYPDRLAGETERVTVFQLQIAANVAIPAGTSVFVIRRPIEVPAGDETELEYEYTMQVPVWL